MLTLAARTIKAKIVLDTVAVAALEIPASGEGRVTIKINVDDRTVTAELNSKSLRKAQSTITEFAPDNVAVFVQGRLGTGNVLLSAGLMAQAKTPKSSDADGL